MTKVFIPVIIALSLLISLGCAALAKEARLCKQAELQMWHFIEEGQRS